MDDETQKTGGRPVLVWFLVGLVLLPLIVVVPLGGEELLIGPGGPVRRFYERIGIFQPLDDLVDGAARVLGL